MSLSCDTDGSYVDLGELTAAAGACECFECGKALAAGDPCYMVRQWRNAYDDDYEEGGALEGRDGEDEVTESTDPCCEACGDLGESVMELGYCWTFGELRSDIAEMRHEKEKAA